MQQSIFAFTVKRVTFLVLVAAVAITGCSGDSFSTANVTGTVTVDGTPVAGIMLEFEPERMGKKILPTAYGMTDAAGHYEVSRVGGPGGKPGAVVGRNTVRLSTPEGSSSKVHPYYADQGAFQREVADGENVFDFEIESRPKAARSQR